jgi:hypothetical protein
LKASGQELAFKYCDCSSRFRMIESDQFPVFIERDEIAKEAIAQMKNFDIRPSGPLRTLASYTVPVYPSAREALLNAGKLKLVASNRFGDRFCRMVVPEDYDPAIGLVWESPDELRASDSIF